MTNTLKILKAARELIAEPEHWTQDSYAVGPVGHFPHNPTDKEACAFCSVGAVARVMGLRGTTAESREPTFVLNEISMKIDNHVDGIISFNDSHTHPEVLAVFDQAIASLSTAEVSP